MHGLTIEAMQILFVHLFTLTLPRPSSQVIVTAVTIPKFLNEPISINFF